MASESLQLREPWDKKAVQSAEDLEAQKCGYWCWLLCPGPAHTPFCLWASRFQYICHLLQHLHTLCDVFFLSPHISRVHLALSDGWQVQGWIMPLVPTQQAW